MTLKIKPVKLNKSIYIRVPSNIVDLIGIDDNVEFALTLEESGNQVALVYSVKRPPNTSVGLPTKSGVPEA